MAAKEQSGFHINVVIFKEDSPVHHLSRRQNEDTFRACSDEASEWSLVVSLCTSKNVSRMNGSARTTKASTRSYVLRQFAGRSRSFEPFVGMSTHTHTHTPHLCPKLLQSGPLKYLC